MMSSIEVPVWLALLIAAVALLGLTTHFFMPGFRWFVRRRVEQVIDDVGTRLNVELPPVMLMRRSALIDRLVYDPDVMDAIAAEAARTGQQREEVARTAEAYAREIAPGFNAWFYFRIGYWIARHFIRFFYRIRIGHLDEAALADLGSDCSVVLVMNHRSNFDYLLVTYLASRRTAVSYAAGEWTLFWPMGNLLRAMGAYFVRRGERDPLYRRVLERYVQMAIEGRVPQGVYPEGALSRDGGLQKPKLGLLDYMTRHFDPNGPQDIVFVPVGINYERVVEDQGLVRNQDEEMISKRGTIFVLRSALGFFLKTTPQLAWRRRVRFGRACANFGRPVSLKSWLAARDCDLRTLERDTRFARIGELADELMSSIGSLIPVLPVSLAATALAEDPMRTMSELELKARVHELVRDFEDRGAHVYLPHGEESTAVSDGLRVLLARHMAVEETAGRYRANPKQRALLDYYAKPVAHLLSRDQIQIQPTPGDSA